MTANPFITAHVSLDSITFDPCVQRSEGIDMKRAAFIASTWDEGAVGVLTLSRRADGTLVIIDGAHRWKGGQILGLSDLLAVIHEGLTLQQEAALFLLLNAFRAPSPISRFLARVVAGEAAAVDINALVVGHGWRIQAGADPGCIAAVTALQDVYKSAAGVLSLGAHRDLLDWVLEVVTAAWEHDPTSVNANILKGLAQMRGRYGSSIQTKKLVHELQQTRPAVLLGRAKNLRDAQGGTIPAAMGKVLTGIHNSRLRVNPLPEWAWIR